MKTSLGLCLAGAMAAVVGCEPSTLQGEGQVGVQPEGRISDAANHGGTAGFFFLPPVAKLTTYGPLSSAGLSPVVEIDEVGGRGTIATFTRTSGPGGVLVKEALHSYYTVWSTRASGIKSGFVYRIRVLLEGRELGYAEAIAVSTLRELVNAYRNEYTPLIGLPLVIAFRIEPAALQPSRCQGVVCAAPDQCHQAGTCDPQTGLCSSPAKPDGTTCDDANACTSGDACIAGACASGAPVSCLALDECHDIGSCEPATGACTNPPRPDGSACNDLDSCSQVDTCQSGTCVGRDPVVCSAQSQCHITGSCDSLTGLCSTPVQADGATCDDQDACTRTDVCHAGECIGSSAVSCVAVDGCHEVGSCDPTTGSCSSPVKPNGAACSDGNACTQEACQGGACVALGQIQCQPVDQCHVAGTCNPGNGQCSNPQAPDGNICTSAGSIASCSAGQCAPQALEFTALGVVTSATVGSSGGRLSTVTPGGIEYSLEFPKGSLLDERQITMTAIEVTAGLPPSLTPLAGVLVEPDDLVLAAPAQLTVHLPYSPGGPVLGVSTIHSGNGIELVPAWQSDQAVTILLHHFSPSIVVEAACDARIPLDSLHGMQLVEAELVNIQIAAMCLYPGDPERRLDYVLDRYPYVANDLYTEVIRPLLVQAESDPGHLPGALDAILLLAKWNDLIGADLEQLEGQAWEDLKASLLVGTVRANTACFTSQSDLETIEYIDFAFVAGTTDYRMEGHDEYLLRFKTCGVQNITLAPEGPVTMNQGDTVTFTATPTDWRGQGVPLPSNVSVAWLAPDMLGLSRSGPFNAAVRAVAPGVGEIRVVLLTRHGGWLATDRTEITVQGSILVNVEPAAVTIPIAQVVTLRASVTSQDGTPTSCDLRWNTSDSSVATIEWQDSTSALIRSLLPGIVIITASCDQGAGAATVTVEGEYRLNVTAACLATGQQQQFSILRSDGTPVTEGVTWSVTSATPVLNWYGLGDVLRVDQSGVATAGVPGKAWIVAEVAAAGKEFAAPVIVTRIPVCGTWAVEVRYVGVERCADPVWSSDNLDYCQHCNHIGPEDITFKFLEDIYPDLSRLFDPNANDNNQARRFWVDSYNFGGDSNGTPVESYCDYSPRGDLSATLDQFPSQAETPGVKIYLEGGVINCYTTQKSFHVNQMLRLTRVGGISLGDAEVGGANHHWSYQLTTCLTSGTSYWSGVLVAPLSTYP